MILGLALASAPCGHSEDPTPSASAPASERTLPPAPPAGAPQPSLSASLSEVVRLVKEGVEEPVLLALVESTKDPFQLGADQIVYLRGLKVSNRAIISMLRHDGLVARGMAPILAADIPEPGTPVEEGDASKGEMELAGDVLEDDTPFDDPTPEFPVRRPYPVRLVDTIVVYRTEGRPSNVQIIGTP